MWFILPTMLSYSTLVPIRAYPNHIIITWPKIWGIRGNETSGPGLLGSDGIRCCHRIATFRRTSLTPSLEPWNEVNGVDNKRPNVWTKWILHHDVFLRDCINKTIFLPVSRLPRRYCCGRLNGSILPQQYMASQPRKPRLDSYFYPKKNTSPRTYSSWHFHIPRTEGLERFWFWMSWRHSEL